MGELIFGFHLRKFSQNEIICKEGATGNVAYILREGSVEISVNVGEYTSGLPIKM